MFFNSRVERIYVTWKLTHFCSYSGSTGEGNDDKTRESVPEEDERCVVFFIFPFNSVSESAGVV